MPESTSRTIKDFIYIDQGRLYSFYSQLNKGIAQQIFKSVIHGESALASQPNPEFDDEVSESQRSRSLQRTESTILYDYMYDQLEERLGDAIVDVSQILPGKALQDLSDDDLKLFFETISSALLVKVSGTVELEDYSRMDEFLKNSNQLMKTFAHFIAISTENLAVIETLEEQLAKETDRNEKAKIKAQIKKLKSPDSIAEDRKLLDDPELVKNLRYLLEVFFGKQFHIAVNITDPVLAAFRAVINRDWLRIDSDILRSLYPGLVEHNWTLVGQVTSKSFNRLETFKALNEMLEKYIATAPSLRDPMRYVFNRVRTLEGILNQNGIRFEPIVFPLAIYRELTLPPDPPEPIMDG